ncbi:D-3-phosphoglycerate dehydrogenase [Pseudoalteromonas luteoviolacea B = ATCC 29581]|nr:D-3-phosphoglycerate dehydrogenase [Pseudoalteromonas luteoviolacea B = ATCC 29581]
MLGWIMNITILDANTFGRASLTGFKALGTVNVFANTTADQIVDRAREAQVIVTNKVVLNHAILAQLPDLKLICVAATGTNNIDLVAAKSLGIAVCNVAGYSTPSVVQHTFTLLGNLMTNMHAYIADCNNGLWQQSDMFCRLDHTIQEINNKTLLIIGHGALGQAVAQVATAFGAHVLVAERKGASTVRSGRIAFEEGLRRADIITLHCPLNDETRDLIDHTEFKLMKPSALLINTARGGVVNETALKEALENNTIAGAGVDVLSKEPAQPDNPLLSYSGHNLLLTPHTAWASQESIERLLNEIVENIQAFFGQHARNRIV